MSENQLVVFTLGEEEFGIDILAVKEIIRYRKTVKLPDTPDFIEGIINYRDSIVPVLDLNKRFRLGGKDEGDFRRIIIVNMGKTGDRQVGFLVDRVEEVLRLDAECIEETPETVSKGMDRQYIRGVGKLEDRLIIILDIERVLSDREKADLREIARTS